MGGGLLAEHCRRHGLDLPAVCAKIERWRRTDLLRLRQWARYQGPKLEGER
jgi:hypothetical protein